MGTVSSSESGDEDEDAWPFQREVEAWGSGFGGKTCKMRPKYLKRDVGE